MSEDIERAAAREIGLCLRCGMSHARENRLRLVRPTRDLSAGEVREAWPCFYPPGDAGEQQLFRDLREVRR